MTLRYLVRIRNGVRTPVKVDSDMADKVILQYQEFGFTVENDLEKKEDDNAESSKTL